MARKPKLGLPLQTLRNAPDIRDGRRLKGGIAEIDPGAIETQGRFDDRLHLDTDGLEASITANGQRVPILLRPLEEGRYSLIYGRRRLEVCRRLGIKVRAIVTDMDGDQALKDQLLENQERQPLSFIERALVAVALLEGDYFEATDRTARNVAEVLNLHEAGVSQLLNVVRAVGPDLIRAIGPAPGIGRPRWEDLKKLLGQKTVNRETLISVASSIAAEEAAGQSGRTSDRAFLAVLDRAKKEVAGQPSSGRSEDATLELAGIGTATIKTNVGGKRFKLDMRAEDPDFVEWLGVHVPDFLSEMHDRWKGRKPD